jgi:hypothetical protein
VPSATVSRIRQRLHPPTPATLLGGVESKPLDFTQLDSSVLNLTRGNLDPRKPTGHTQVTPGAHGRYNDGEYSSPQVARPFSRGVDLVDDADPTTPSHAWAYGAGVVQGQRASPRLQSDPPSVHSSSTQHAEAPSSLPPTPQSSTPQSSTRRLDFPPASRRTPARTTSLDAKQVSVSMKHERAKEKTARRHQN